MGLLTADTFAGLAEQIGATIKKLEEQGVSEQDIMLAILPQLQLLWELQKQYGIELDKTTQKYLDMAVAQGKVGEHMKSDSKQQIDLMKRVAEAVELLARALAGAAGQAQRLRDKMKQIPPPPTGGGGGGGNEPEPPDSDGDGVPDSEDGYPNDPEHYSTGTLGKGSLFRNFGTGTLAELHGLEAVLTPSQLDAITASNVMVGASAMRDGMTTTLDTRALQAEVSAMRREIRDLRAGISTAVRDAVAMTQ
jgi:hypothetical protein